MANIIVSSIGPRNTTEKLWNVTSIGGFNGDHGLTVDISKKYMVFCWVYKEALIGSLACSLSFGIRGSVLNNSSGASVSNPNFADALSWRTGGSLYGYDDQWLFCCGYVFPSTISNTATTYGGIYTRRGTKIYSCVDYRWDVDPSPWEGESISQSNGDSNIIYIARPSILLCDEFEPNIKRMIGL